MSTAILACLGSRWFRILFTLLYFRVKSIVIFYSTKFIYKEIIYLELGILNFYKRRKVMSAEWYLGQAYRLNEKIEDKRERIMKLRELAKNLSSIDYSKDRVQTSFSNEAGFEEIIADADALERELIDDIADLLKFQCKINNAIDDIKDVNCSLVLSKRYLLMKSWKQIAVEMDYSLAQTYRIHRKALNMFVIPKHDTK